MQTFLPYSSFAESAKCLDRERLGKQRVEVLQILKTLDEKSGWINHPATLMWKNHPRLLILYGSAICREWKSRGYKDTCLQKILEYRNSSIWQTETTFPKWYGNDNFHKTHRAQLLRKDEEFYSQYGWKEVPNQFPYCWGNCKGYLTTPPAQPGYMYLCNKCHSQRFNRDDKILHHISNKWKENPKELGNLVSCWSCGKWYILSDFAGDF